MRSRLILFALVLSAACACGRISYDAIASDEIEDAAQALFRCSLELDGVVSLLTFDNDDLADLRGKHDGELRDGTLEFTTGPSDCGNAINLGNVNGPHILIPDSSDWDLSVGSVDFWMRADLLPATDWVGLITRDAAGEAVPNHLGLFLSSTGQILLRAQEPPTTNLGQCGTNPIPLGEWLRVGVNFGPPAMELYVNGQRNISSQTVFFPGSGDISCNDTVSQGIDGNDSPWVLGASGHSSNTGGAEGGVGQHFRNGAMDHFRVSSVRRDYAAGE